MSFMMTTGMFYICENCKGVLKAEYKGGPMYTQVGEFGIFHQQALEQKYGFNEGRNPEEGVYLYNEAICDKCVDKSKIAPPEFLDSVEAFSNAANTFEHLSQELGWKALECLKDADIDWIKSISPEDYQKTISSSRFIPKYKKDAKRFIEQYLDQIKKKVVRAVIDRYPELKEFTETMTTGIEKVFNSAIPEIKKTIAVIGENYYIPKDISLTENLNAYICYEGTMRTPIEGTPKICYYDEGGTSVEGLESEAAEIRGKLKERYYEQNVYLIRDIIKELNKILKRELLNE